MQKCKLLLAFLLIVGLLGCKKIDHSDDPPGCCSKTKETIKKDGAVTKGSPQPESESLPPVKYIVIEFGDGTIRRFDAGNYRELGNSYDILGPNDEVLATIPIDKVKVVRPER